MADESEPSFESDPSPAALEMAKLHATAWEYAAGSLSSHCQQDPNMPQRRMQVTPDQMRSVMWMAYAVAGGYRRIVNGAKLKD